MTVAAEFLGSTQPQPSQDMPFVVLWSDTAQGSYCRDARACGIFDAIFVPATKGPARKPGCIPYLRVVDCFRVVDRLRDISAGEEAALALNAALGDGHMTHSRQRRRDNHEQGNNN